MNQRLQHGEKRSKATILFFCVPIFEWIMNEWAKLNFYLFLFLLLISRFSFLNCFVIVGSTILIFSKLAGFYLSNQNYKTLTTQTTPNLWPANSATCVRSARSQMRTEGWCPHSPVTTYLPSAEKATAVNVLRDTLTRWVCRFLRGLNSTIEHLQRQKTKEKKGR